MTEEDARKMRAELLLLMSDKKAKDYPNVAEVLRQLTIILKQDD